MRILIISLPLFLSVILPLENFTSKPNGECCINCTYSSALTGSDNNPQKEKNFIGSRALIIIDGCKVPHKQQKTINPDSCESIMNLKPNSALARFGKNGKNGAIIITTLRFGKTLKENDPDAAESIFSKAEVMPEFPGGELALRSLVANTIIYPREAQMKGIQGKVYVGFVINSKGAIEEAKIVQQGPDSSLETEALRVVSQIPPYWKPGTNRGIAVNVAYIIPISFVIR